MFWTEIEQKALDELAELRRKLLLANKQLKNTGSTAVTRMMAFVTTEISQVWESTAPKLTGTLRSATRERIFQSTGSGRVYIDPAVENPVFGGFPVKYGPEVHERKPWVAQLFVNNVPGILEKGGTQLFHELDGIFR